MRAADVPHLRHERDHVGDALPGRHHRHRPHVRARHVIIQYNIYNAIIQYYNRFLQQLATHRPTTLQLAPPLVAFLAGHPMVTQDHLASLKTVSSHHIVY